MSEVLFYHLTQTTLDKTLPGLVERSLERKWRVSIQFDSEKLRDEMDNHLWALSPISFIPHGLDSDNWPHEQPVILTCTDENPNLSTVRFCIEGAQCKNVDNYERIVIIFDGHNGEQLKRVRAQWKELKAAGHTVTYWQQNENQKWEKKA